MILRIQRRKADGWEGRFKSQALLDERALLACMAYVDLNPIRAAMAQIPEQSDYTSIQERIRHPNNEALMPFKQQDENSIPINLKDYLELVDWGGREIKRNKRGYIPASAPSILLRLKMDAAPVLDYLAKDDLPKEPRHPGPFRNPTRYQDVLPYWPPTRRFKLLHMPKARYRQVSVDTPPLEQCQR